MKTIKQLIDELESTIESQLQDESTVIDFLFGFFHDFPFPAWIKTMNNDNEIRVARVNHAYEEAFGLDTKSVIEREIESTLEEVHEWTKNDYFAIERGTTIRDIEDFTDKDGNIVQLLTYKWPLRSIGFKGVCGIALPLPEKN